MTRKLMTITKGTTHTFFFPEKASSRTGVNSRNPSRHSSRVTSRNDEAVHQVAAPETEQPRSWMLDHVAEIVHLSTQIQMTQQINDAINEFQQGHQEALQVCTWQKSRPQTYDRYSALHTQHSMYLNGGILSVEYESTFKTPDSDPCI